MRRCPSTQVLTGTGHWAGCELTRGHYGRHRARLAGQWVTWPDLADRQSGSRGPAGEAAGWTVTDEGGGRHHFARWQDAADDMRHRVWNWAETRDEDTARRTAVPGHIAATLHRDGFGVGWTPQTPQHFVIPADDPHHAAMITLDRGT